MEQANVAANTCGVIASNERCMSTLTSKLNCFFYVIVQQNVRRTHFNREFLQLIETFHKCQIHAMLKIAAASTMCIFRALQNAFYSDAKIIMGVQSAFSLTKIFNLRIMLLPLSSPVN